MAMTEMNYPLSGATDRLESGKLPSSSATVYQIKADAIKSFTLYAYIDTGDSYFHNFHYNAATNKLYYDQTQRSSSEVSYSNGYINLNISASLGSCWAAYYMLYDYS